MESVRTYKEYDEVKAPDDLPEADVKAGDRGVVVMEFDDRGGRPPAIMVEYADREGQTKALVTYSTDLGQTFGVYPEPD